ncbi:MAG: glycosyltransferase family 2 protein [Acidobacteriota bacterium]
MLQNAVSSGSQTSANSKGVVDVSIVIVNFNNKKYLEPCLDSIYNAGLRSTFEIVIVDNGSTDGSQDMIRARFPEIPLLENAKNIGLPAACNQGMAISKGRYILLLNDDTLVNAPSFDAMIDFLDKNPTAGAVGGRLLNPDGTLQAGYTKFSTLYDEFLIACGLTGFMWEGFPSRADATEPTAVDWIGSASLLLRPEALQKVGVLDEEYFIYGDEADLQYRLKKSGWLVYYLPNVTTIHFGGRSMDRWKRRKMVYRGKMLFFRKNYGPVQTALLRLMLGVLSVAKMMVWVVAYPFPKWRVRAERELRSNMDVVKLCLRLA